MALVMLAGISLQSRAISTLTAQVQELETISAKYRPLIERVNRLSEEKRDLEAKIHVIEALDKERDFRVRLLEELNRHMPRYAWLTKFVESGGSTAEIEGTTFSNLVVSDFIQGLEKSGLYNQVDLTVAKRAEIGNRDVVDFKMTANLSSSPAATLPAGADEATEASPSEGPAEAPAADTAPQEEAR
jgi:Tfp pilus assembly protein PilN